MAKVLILGGGIAGVEAAIYCRKEGMEVELISDRTYCFIYPISIWIPVSGLPFERATLSLDLLARRHGFTFTHDRVSAIHPDEHRITLASGEERIAPACIIALGGAKVSTQGMEHTLSICAEPEQSLAIQERLEALIAQGGGRLAFGFGGNPKDSSAVRGGPGFELFFNVHHYLTRKGVRDRFEMTFFAPMAQPGERMGPKALQLMEMMFRRNGFKSHYGKKIARFESDRVVFEDESTIPSDLTMFIAAGSGLGVIGQSGLPLNEAGFIRINDFGAIKGVNGWYAIGDVAAMEGPQWRAKQGHIAEVMARNAAHNLACALGLKNALPKGYQEHINILCLMDMGNGGGWVYRDEMRARMIPLPIVGHWLKIGWGWYYKLSKMGYIPRIPGM